MHNAKQSRDKYVSSPFFSFFFLRPQLRAFGNIFAVSNKNYYIARYLNRSKLRELNENCMLGAERSEGLRAKSKGLSKGNLHILVINKSIFFININVYLYILKYTFLSICASSNTAGKY